MIGVCFVRIEKWDTPEGDGNRRFAFPLRRNLGIEKWDTQEGDGNFSAFRIGLVTTIEKWDTPEGDGNSVTKPTTSALFIEKWDTPEGDGNRICSRSCFRSFHWEMRYPGRGRKPPAGGVDTSVTDWEMRYPGRGRKQKQILFSSLFYIEKWDTPEGDGNMLYFPTTALWSIEKWDTPEGDGNLNRIWK